MASCPLRSIAIEKKPLFSCLPSRDLVPAIDQVSHPIQIVGPNLHSINPFESLDMCPISDDLLPSDEVFLDCLIEFDLLMDVGLVMTKYNHDFLSKTYIPMDRSSYVGIFEFLDSPFK